jgi:outer membrane protein assembly factor BamB
MAGLRGRADVTTAMIDLGRDRSVPGGRPRRRDWRARWFAVVGVLLALLLGGSAAAPAPRLTPVLTLPASAGMSFLAAGDTLYLAARDDSGDWRLTAHRLPDGAIRWSMPLADQAGGILDGVARGRVLLLSSRDQALHGQLWGAVDMATGRVLWRVADVARVVWAWLPAGWTTVSSPAGSAPRVLVASGDEAGESGLRSLDARSGRLVWSRSLPAAVVQTFVPARDGGGADRIVLLAPDGNTEVIAADTGRTLVAGRLDVPPAATEPVAAPGRPELSVAGDEAVVSYPHGDAAVIIAYDLGTLAERWRVTRPTTGIYISACGQLLCVGDQTGLTGVDPATGRDRWHTPAWFAAEPTVGGLVASVSDRPHGRRALIDPRTGQTQLDLTGWSLPIASIDAPTSLIVGRGDGQDDRVWVGALDPAPPTLRLLGWLTAVTDDSCSNTATYLACSTPDLHVRVWRYHP